MVCAWRLFSLSPAQRTVFLQIRKNMVKSIKYKESALYSYRNPQRKRHAVMSQIIWQLWSVRSIVYIRKVVTARSLKSVVVFVQCKRPRQIGLLETLQRYGAQAHFSDTKAKEKFQFLGRLSASFCGKRPSGWV